MTLLSIGSFRLGWKRPWLRTVQLVQELGVLCLGLSNIFRRDFLGETGRLSRLQEKMPRLGGVERLWYSVPWWCKRAPRWWYNRKCDSLLLFWANWLFNSLSVGVLRFKIRIHLGPFVKPFYHFHTDLPSKLTRAENPRIGLIIMINGMTIGVQAQANVHLSRFCISMWCSAKLAVLVGWWASPWLLTFY